MRDLADRHIGCYSVSQDYTGAEHRARCTHNHEHPQIITDDHQLDNLDPDSIVLDGKGRVRLATSMWSLPAVVVATGSHVRACREALEGGEK